MHFGAALRLFRMERGLGLREVARLIGVSGSYLSRVENGHDPPPAPDRLAALADVLGIDRALLIELAGQVGPEITSYIHRVPAAASLLLELARRDLGPVAVARLRAFVDEEYPEARPRRPARRATDLLAPERIVLGLRCLDFDDVLSTLVARLPALPGLSGKEILKSARRREESASTLLGGGFALPHTAPENVGAFPGTASLALLGQPLSIATPDGQPLRFAAFVLLPHSKKGEGAKEELSLLAAFARLAAAVNVTELAGLSSETEVHRMLVELESSF